MGVFRTTRPPAAWRPRHGLFVLARDIYDAFEVTERMDVNAYCILQAQQLGGVTSILERTQQ
ncbi:MAG: hypothetical protein WA110_04110 [Anaerolineaceae bacterium]